MSDAAIVLAVEALTREAFAAFGDVIEPANAATVYAINAGTTTRFHDLAPIDTARDGGRPLLSLFRAQPRELPFAITMLERHPLGSQAFVPLSQRPYLVVVADHPDALPRAFLARDGQGVNYRAGTWHHPLLALGDTSDFLVIDRGGPGDNCDEVTLPRVYCIAADQSAARCEGVPAQQAPGHGRVDDCEPDTPLSPEQAQRA